jgi:hypothetical protein
MCECMFEREREREAEVRDYLIESLDLLQLHWMKLTPEFGEKNISNILGRNLDKKHLFLNIIKLLLSL